MKIKVTRYSAYQCMDLEKILVEGKEVKVGRVVALCRCGQSRNQPYCDGTHVKIKFDGENDSECIGGNKGYKHGNFEVLFNVKLCSHNEACIKGLPTVFNRHQKPWIQVREDEVETCIDVIKQCPSGALSYRLNGVEVSKWKESSSVEVQHNGPLVCTKVELECSDILQDEVNDDHYVLCRCGKSTNKPFCDGNHYGLYFDE